ncbi:MAG: hypothetical protein AMJ38_00510 [Dehalococcoidia bacterium DG_22]|nr:MAG: hypothetical protein AMJ38_00510 [Dehalococcoidia bacterium DG_22]
MELTYTADGSRDFDTFFAQRRAIEEANPGLTEWLTNREALRWTEPRLQQTVRDMMEATRVADEYYSIPTKMGMSAADQDEVKAIVERAQAIARRDNTSFEYALLQMDIPETTKFKALMYRKLPRNPARERYERENQEKWRLFVTFYDVVPLEEPTLEMAGVR